MQFKDLVNKAVQVQKAYDVLNKATLGKTWSKANFAEGLVGDVGDLMKLIMAKEGIRHMDNVDERLAHELSDCLWAIIVLAESYGVDLEVAFMKNMDNLKAHIESKFTSK